tara:strand:- start:2327 stop:2584 length:258 start_codon:yes stop_codon:yes gene_type:complete
MTNSGMFEDAEKIIYLENQNKLLKLKLKEAVSKIKRIQGLEEHHLKNNGDLRVENNKLERNVVIYKADIDRLSEENANLKIMFKK